MDEVLRVLQMLKEGKIRREEAERLLAALGVGPSSEGRVRRWLRVEGGQATIRVVPAAGDAVSASGFGAGRTVLTTDETGGLLKIEARGPKLFKKSFRVDLKLPRDYGVELALGAGALRAESLPGLRGELGTGKLEAAGIRELDLDLGMGTARLGLLLQEGEHRIEVGMGDVEIYPLPGASFRIEGEAGLGRVEEQIFGEGRARLLVKLGMGRLKVRS